MTSKPLLLITIFSFLAGTVVITRPLDAQQGVGGGTSVAGSTGGAAFPNNGPQLAAVPPGAPEWIPLSPAHEQYVDQVLKYWEYKSGQVKRYRCVFRRWEYDPVFGPSDTFNTHSEGVVKYAAPDKGLFRVEKTLQYQVPREPGGKPAYVLAPPEKLEHWVCDGRWVWEFDYQNTRLIQTELPPEMRGQSIGNGPLPFLFNAKAEDIKRRFWIHARKSDDSKNEYWLEAVPRTQQDAANFKMIHLFIDATDYLPKAMVLFGNGKAASRTTYEFANRDVNFSILTEQLNLFHREFYEPTAPSGWQKVVRKWNQSVTPPDAATTTARASDEMESRR